MTLCFLSTSDAKPTLAKLMLLKSADKKQINVIDRLAPDWNHFGILVDFDDEGIEVKHIDMTHDGDPKACCLAMFQHWFRGNGRKLLSWRTLIELLEHLDLNVLASEVQNALKVFLVVIEGG